MKQLAWLVLSWLVLAAEAAHAAGRIEINQASVDAAGGFPFTLGAPGSYVLTGSLTVPAGTNGFVLATNEVVLDLNGFAIAGPASCQAGTCTVGSGSAVVQQGAGLGHRSTIRGGVVRGFGASCIVLGAQSHVEDLLVTECGRNGILVSEGSLVLRNRVFRTGEHGIYMSGSGSPPSYAHNAIADVSLAGAGFYGVHGGRASAGNSCEDGSCAPGGQRRFYFTPTSYTGGTAASACGYGFRVASLTEIWDFSNLHYVPTLGSPTPGGMPVDGSGWLHFPGFPNCNGYTSLAGNGYVGRPLSASPSPNYNPWLLFTDACTASKRVWCIEE